MPQNLSTRDELISEYRSYVHKLVTSLIHKMSLPTKLYDDLVSAGYLGLVEAAERYDKAAGKEFRSYAFLRIRGSIIDSLRESSEFSGRAYRYAKALQAAQDLKEEDQRKHKQISSDATLDLARVFDYASKGALAFRMSMSDVNEEVSEKVTSESNPEETLASKQKFAGLRKLIEELPEKERIVLEEYYYNEKTFSEIADEHEGMSKSWVSKLHSRAIDMLKEQYLTDSLSEEGK